MWLVHDHTHSHTIIRSIINIKAHQTFPWNDSSIHMDVAIEIVFADGRTKTLKVRLIILYY